LQGCWFRPGQVILLLPLIGLFMYRTPENLTFQIGDIVRREGDQLLAAFSRIAQEVEIILSPVMLIEQDFSCMGAKTGIRRSALAGQKSIRNATELTSSQRHSFEPQRPPLEMLSRSCAFADNNAQRYIAESGYGRLEGAHETARVRGACR
jgi:hypothetical protein